MRIAFFDCVGGVSGDMLLSALLDAGASEDGVRDVIKKMDLPGCDIRVEQVMKGALASRLVTVITPENGVERHLADLTAIINQADFSENMKRQACNIIERIARVEAGIHNSSLDHVHLHEVGGDDTLIDILGVLNALRELKIERVYSSALPLAQGMINCMHGLIPLPAPATLALLKDTPVRFVADVEAELVTPTGAALLTSLVDDFGGFPPMRIKTIGTGAGHKDLPFPNVVRVWIGETQLEHPHKVVEPSLAFTKGMPETDHHHHDHEHAHDHPHVHSHDHNHDNNHSHTHEHAHEHHHQHDLSE